MNNTFSLPVLSPDYCLDLNVIKKYSKVIAFKLQNDLIVDYKRTPGTNEFRIYTVESVTSEGIRLFQVGNYENPLLFTKTGRAITEFRSKNWFNWNNYVVYTYNKDQNV